jgi:hypothetical membrane protein
MPLRRFGFYCGIISPVLWLGFIALAGALRPDFSHVTNYISELAERGSTTEAFMRYGAFGFTGFLYICFAGALVGVFRNGWLQKTVALLIALEGIGRMGAGVFPCDAGCVHISPGPNLHKLFATVGFCAGIAAALVSGRVFRDIPPLRSLSSLSLGAGAAALVSLLVMSSAAGPGLPPGGFEHVATVVLSVWVLVLAVRLVRAEKSS